MVNASLVQKTEQIALSLLLPPATHSSTLKITLAIVVWEILSNASSKMVKTSLLLANLDSTFSFQATFALRLPVANSQLFVPVPLQSLLALLIIILTPQMNANNAVTNPQRLAHQPLF